MNKLLITTALVAFGATPLFAQEAETKTETDSSLFFTAEEGAGADLAASNLIGQRIYSTAGEVEFDDGVAELDPDWEDIGEVNDVIIAMDGSVEALIVDVGGFLGIGERQIAMKMSDIKFVNDSDDDGYYLLVAASQDQLENAPEFDQKIIGSWAAVEAVENAAEGIGEGMETAGIAAKNAAGDIKQETGELAENVEEGADKLAAEGEKVAENAKDGAEKLAAEGEQVAENTEAEVKGEVAEHTDVAEAPEAAPLPADGTATAEANADAQPNWQAADVATLTADELTGAPIYDPNDDRIGEVSELILDDSGERITEAVLDIGGFLGLGEHSVAMSIDQIDIQTDGQTGEVRVVVNQTKDELEAMPEYQGKM